ncbi:MAG: Brp/Blh family beta-carotene 15,15'-dioxygenase [Rhodothermaceae bacterium]|nr:Brp/Blh family beta-carotene 15,15'-dioxygenase [Rhodothermaceae bacterium]
MTGSVILAVGLSFLVPEAMDWIAPWLLFFAVFVIGIPHGAVDHVVAADLYGMRQRVTDHLLFYSSYLLVMLLVGLLWLFYPLVGMVLFLLISVYHFGQADMVALVQPASPFSALFSWSRGLMVITAIIFTDPYVCLPIIEAAIRMSPEWLSSLYQYSSIILVAAVVQYYAIVLIVLSLGALNVSRLRFLGDSLLLTALLVLTHPLIGFAFYFALWHSMGHVQEMISFFRDNGRHVTIWSFYRLALPFTLVSLFGLSVLFFVQRTYSVGNEMISLLFILISVLTLPHMIIVDRMFARKAI